MKTIMELINTELIVSFLAILIFIILNVFSRRIIEYFGPSQHIPYGQQKKLIRVTRFFTALLLIVVLTAIWGFGILDMWVFATTFLGLLGMAIFAVWSLLSNTFAAYILFFSECFGIGDTITLMDANNSVTGEVVDMTLFFVRVKTSDGGIANIPNNIALQKTVIRHTQKKLF